MLTRSNDYQRTGQNTSEITLNPLNVNKTQFGKICAAPTDGQIYAQPLVVTGVPITLNGATQQYNVV